MTAFQSNAFQPNAFQEYGGVTATETEIQISIVQDGDTVSLQLQLPSQGAGGFNRFSRFGRNYIVKGRKYYNLTNEELCVLIAREYIDLTREDIKVSYKNKKPHLISKEYFSTLQDTLKALEIEPEDDEEETLMMLM